MEYKEIKTLEEFVEQIEKELLKNKNQYPFEYPADAIENWEVDKIDKINSNLLDDISGKANLYAIFTAPKNSNTYSLQYIGKTTRKLARQRIRNHLIKKHHKTGAKLDKIETLVKAGGKVKISWVKINPESLRNYVEEELIHKHIEAEWNQRIQTTRRE